MTSESVGGKRELGRSASLSAWRKQMRSATLTALLAVGAVAVAGSAQAQVKRDYARPDARFATSISVPATAELVFFSGALAPPSAPGAAVTVEATTESQATAIFRDMEAKLKAQGLGLGDIVNMKIYLMGDPAKGGAMDFAGLNAAYGRVFGTPSQPHRPTRSTFQIAGIAVPGALVEIDIVAVRTKP